MKKNIEAFISNSYRQTIFFSPTPFAQSELFFVLFYTNINILHITCIYYYLSDPSSRFFNMQFLLQFFRNRCGQLGFCENRIQRFGAISKKNVSYCCFQQFVRVPMFPLLSTPLKLGSHVYRYQQYLFALFKNSANPCFFPTTCKYQF